MKKETVDVCVGDVENQGKLKVKDKGGQPQIVGRKVKE
jgi:hypothetical protein